MITRPSLLRLGQTSAFDQAGIWLLDRRVCIFGICDALFLRSRQSQLSLGQQWSAPLPWVQQAAVGSGAWFARS